MQIAFSDGSHIVDNPAGYHAAHRRLNLGVGDTSSGSIAAVAAQGAATTGGILSGLSAMGALSPAFAIAGPIGAAVAGLVSIGLAIASQFQGCGSTCTAAANFDNQAEALLLQNLQTYMSAPVHYASMQAAAINNFMTFWNAYTQAEASAATGSQGQISISQRQQGGCFFKTSPGGWQQQNGTWVYVGPGANGSGTACWNWFVGYLDPIQNDPTVVPDPVGAVTDPTTGAVTSISAPSTSIMPLLLLGGAGLAAVMLLGDN